MKIIAGSLGGRPLTMPKAKDTRPVTLMLRAAIFNVLGQHIKGAQVLDLYAGSGALGLEAISRGAAQATLVDIAKSSISVIKQNVEKFGVNEQVEVVHSNVADWLPQNKEQFDLVFFDPPYDSFDEEVLKLVAPRMSKDGILVVSTSKRQVISDKIAGLQSVQVKKYGDTRISYYRK